MEDYYEILEVSRTATISEIKSSYRKLALKYHPDRNQGDKEAEEKFKKINQAYEILGNEEKRAMYDRYGEAGISGSSYSSDPFEDLGDIFASFFGGGFSDFAKRDLDKYMLDIEINITLEFKEAIFGTNKDIKYKIKTPCKECDGSGSKDKNTKTCPYCKGKGKISKRQGFVNFVQTCPECQGSGQIIKEKCPKCKGKTYQEEEVSLNFNVPKGVDNGMRIRIANKGNVSKNGEVGDLYIEIRVKEDKLFKRYDDNLFIQVPIFFTQAILGESILIPTLSGDKKELKLHVGTKDKERFIIKNEGVENINTKITGNLIVEIDIKTPKKLDEKQTKLLKELQESFNIDHKNNKESILDKTKSWIKKFIRD